MEETLNPFFELLFPAPQRHQIVGKRLQRGMQPPTELIDFTSVNWLQMLTARENESFALIVSLFLDPNSQSTSAATNCLLAMSSPTISRREPPHIETIRTPM
jgi:hypothetical protein